MSTRAVIRRAGQAEAVSLAGLPLVFLVTGERAKHTSMFHWTVAPGFSTGLHVHEIQEETFYVLEGECEWQIGEEHVKAGPGTYTFIPPASLPPRRASGLLWTLNIAILHIYALILAFHYLRIITR